MECMMFEELLESPPSWLGRRVLVKGKLLMAGYRCWLIRSEGPREMETQSEGGLIRLPGLGAEAWHFPGARITNGKPWLSVPEVTIEGRVVPAEHSPFALQLADISALTLRGEGHTKVVDLARIDELSEFELHSVQEWPDPEHQRLMREKYERQRTEW